MKTKLVSDDAVKGMRINVEVHKGVVSLYGRVPNEIIRGQALKLAGEVKGVSKVEDRLTLVPEGES